MYPWETLQLVSADRPYLQLHISFTKLSAGPAVVRVIYPHLLEKSPDQSEGKRYIFDSVKTLPD